MPVIPVIVGIIKQEYCGPGWPGQKVRDSIIKITRAKRAGGMAEAVENLPRKCKAMNSNSNTLLLLPKRRKDAMKTRISLKPQFLYP
jgi:hypothetical protein